MGKEKAATVSGWELMRRTGTMLNILVGLGLVLTIGLDLASGGKVRRVIGGRLKQLGQPAELSRAEQIDQFCYQRLPEGNVYLRFLGFDAQVREDESFISRHYYRLSYTLYPRRVYASTQGRAIRNGRELLAANDPPPTDWIEARGVRYVVTFEKRDGRLLPYHVRRVE